MAKKKVEKLIPQRSRNDRLPLPDQRTKTQSKSRPTYLVGTTCLLFHIVLSWYGKGVGRGDSLRRAFSSCKFAPVI